MPTSAALTSSRLPLDRSFGSRCGAEQGENSGWKFLPSLHSGHEAAAHRPGFQRRRLLRNSRPLFPQLEVPAAPASDPQRAETARAARVARLSLGEQRVEGSGILRGPALEYGGAGGGGSLAGSGRMGRLSFSRRAPVGSVATLTDLKRASANRLTESVLAGRAGSNNSEAASQCAMVRGGPAWLLEKSIP